MNGRTKTKYPGVFYREAERIGGEGKEKVFYIVFKKDGKVLEEKVGRQFADDMTPAKAASIRSQRIEGKRVSPKEKRRVEKERKIAEDSRPTMTRLWDEYKRQRPVDKSLRTDDGRFHLHLAPYFGGKTPAEIISLDVDRIRVRMLKTHAPQTVKHVVALLKRIIRFGVKKGLCPESDRRLGRGAIGAAHKIHRRRPEQEGRRHNACGPFYGYAERRNPQLEMGRREF